MAGWDGPDGIVAVGLPAPAPGCRHARVPAARHVRLGRRSHEVPCTVSGPSASVFRSVRRPPRRGWLRTTKFVLAGLLTIGVLAAGVVGAVWAEAWLRLGGERLPALSEDIEALGADGARAPSGATTVLVALVEEHDPVAARDAPLAGEVALVQVAAQRDEVAVVLLPTALEVAVDGEGDLPLDEVHRQGGLNLLTRSIMDYTSVAIDHAVSASTQALPELTDALGGVEHCDEIGCRILDADAVRTMTLEGASAERAEAVAAIVRGLGEQVGPAHALRSPLRSRAVISALADEVVTDVSLRGMRVLSVADALSASRPLAVAGLAGVVNPDSERLVVRPEQAETLFQHLRQGSPLEGDAVTAGSEAVPEDVTVAVLNGAGVAGLAGRIESQLQGAGFTSIGTDNAPRFDHEETVVAYGADDPAAEVAAVLLAEQLGGVSLDPRDRPPSFEGEPVGVLVTVGQDLDDEEDD